MSRTLRRLLAAALMRLLQSVEALATFIQAGIEPAL